MYLTPRAYQDKKQLPAAPHKATFGISQIIRFACSFIYTATQFVSLHYKTTEISVADAISSHSVRSVSVPTMHHTFCPRVHVVTMWMNVSLSRQQHWPLLIRAAVHPRSVQIKHLAIWRWGHACAPTLHLLHITGDLLPDRLSVYTSKPENFHPLRCSSFYRRISSGEVAQQPRPWSPSNNFTFYTSTRFLWFIFVEIVWSACCLHVNWKQEHPPPTLPLPCIYLWPWLWFSPI